MNEAIGSIYIAQICALEEKMAVRKKAKKMVKKKVKKTAKRKVCKCCGRKMKKSGTCGETMGTGGR
jgi:hypothetical protein